MMLGFTEWLKLHGVASKRQNATSDHLLKNLKAKFKWVATIVDKLGIPPPSQLTDTELPSTEGKRKRIVEIIKELLVSKDIMVDGMHMNLIVPQGVTASARLAIKEPEARTFFHNKNLDLVFYRRSKYNLATTPQLIRIQNSIKIDSELAQEIYDELIYVIKARPDFVEVRKIVEKNLDGLGMD
nr:hypothetical protein [Tanacetum cinerariifolium]